MPRIEPDNDDDQGRVRSRQVLDGLREQLEALEQQSREGKQFRNIVMVVDAVDNTGEPDFGVITAEDSHLTTVVGMLALAQAVSAQNGLRMEELEEVPVKQPKPPGPRLM